MTAISINNNHTGLSANPSVISLNEEEQQKSSSKFMRTLIHEVRNPLTNINLAVEMLSRVTSDISLRPYLDIILRSSGKINVAVTDLLKNPDLYEDRKEYCVEQLLEEAYRTTEDRSRLKKITVIKDYTKEDCNITLNGAKIKIALANIILNAIDAMEAEKGILKFITRSEGGKYVVYIRDNGCGISEQNLANIFKPFFTNKP